MTITFAAKDMHTEKTANHVLVGFADSLDDARDFIVLMRAGVGSRNGVGGSDGGGGRDDPADIHAKAYFEYSGQENSGYGCVSEVTLGADQVIFKIDKLRCPELPDSEFVVTLAIDQPARMELADRLGEILSGTAELKIIGD